MGQMYNYDSKLFWTPDAALSYDKLLNFILGGTGIGKTFGMKKFVCNRFKKYREQFIWMRRYEKDLADISGFFNDSKLLEQLGDTSEDWRICRDGSIQHRREKDSNGKFVIYDDSKYPSEKDILKQGDWEIAGYWKPLNVLMKKGVEYPAVWWIIFEEFIPHNFYQRYIPNEFECFLKAYDAVHRYIRPVKVFFLGNNESLYNPYMLAIDCEPNGKRFWVHPSADGTGLANDSLVEFCDNVGVANAHKKTRMGRLIEGTNYGDHALDNKSLLLNNVFIGKKGGFSVGVLNIVIDGNKYGVWADSKNSKFYVSENVCVGRDFYALRNSDHDTSTLCFRIIKSSPIWLQILRAYDTGLLYFETQKCKGAMMTIIKDNAFK